MDNIFYDYSKVLSYNAMLNFLLGERGVGKTYGATKFVVNQFLKKHEEFVYVRRYKNELNISVNKFFSVLNMNNEFENHILSNKGKYFFCDGEVCGYALTLSTSQDLKGVNFSNVKTIIFDEFIIEAGQKKYYLQNEVFTFLNLLETIARLRDVRVFLLGNAFTQTNPYFLYFDLHLPYNSDIALFKNNTILVQYMKNEKYREIKQKSKLGLLTENTDYADYAIENKFVGDNQTFLGKKTGTSKFTCAFIIDNHTFGVWIDYLSGLVFVSDDYVKDTPFMFSMSLKDHSENTTLFKYAKKYSCWRIFIDSYLNGNVRFENLKIKSASEKLLKKIIIHG